MIEPHLSDAPAFNLTRRAALAWTASAIALLAAPLPAAAQDPALAQFMALSRKITAFQDLSDETGTRILAALAQNDATTAAALERLAALAQSAPDAAALRDAAAAAQLGDLLTSVLSSWYTGTVVTGEKSTVVAYRDALMYRPVEDGLTVPTYCNKGPMWWRDTLPPGITRTPVNFPKVL